MNEFFSKNDPFIEIVARHPKINPQQTEEESEEIKLQNSFYNLECILISLKNHPENPHIILVLEELSNIFDDESFDDKESKYTPSDNFFDNGIQLLILQKYMKLHQSIDEAKNTDVIIKMTNDLGIIIDIIYKMIRYGSIRLINSIVETELVEFISSLIRNKKWKSIIEVEILAHSLKYIDDVNKRFFAYASIEDVYSLINGEDPNSQIVLTVLVFLEKIIKHNLTKEQQKLMLTIINELNDLLENNARHLFISKLMYCLVQQPEFPFNEMIDLIQTFLITTIERNLYDGSIYFCCCTYMFIQTLPNEENIKNIFEIIHSKACSFMNYSMKSLDYAKYFKTFLATEKFLLNNSSLFEEFMNLSLWKSFIDYDQVMHTCQSDIIIFFINLLEEANINQAEEIISVRPDILSAICSLLENEERTIVVHAMRMLSVLIQKLKEVSIEYLQFLDETNVVRMQELLLLEDEEISTYAKIILELLEV